jgi:adenylate cyclase class 2
MKNQEIKILNIDVMQVQERLIEIGAKKVFDDIRVITYFKNKNDTGQPFLKLTQEEKLKLTSQNLVTHEEIKLFVSRKEECLTLLGTLGYSAVSEVRARRISYEINGIDCDIDIFPEVPPFMEVDMGSSTDFELKDFLLKLNCLENKKEHISTPDLFHAYGKDYFEIFKIEKNSIKDH